MTYSRSEAQGLALRACCLRYRSRAAAVHPQNVPLRTTRGAVQNRFRRRGHLHASSKNPVRAAPFALIRLASQISPKFTSKSLPEIRSEVPEEFPEGASKRCPSYPKRSHPDTCKPLSANKIFCTRRPALSQRQTTKGPFGNRRRPYDRPQFPSEFAQGCLSQNVELDLQKTP